MQAVRFQSTLPRRERPSSVTRACPCWNFNPRSREGSDRSPARLRPIYSYFNPRSREGSDNAQVDFFCGKQDFNPRSREGSDAGVWQIIKATAAFQSTLPRRERRTLRPPATSWCHFNPRSREGSDGIMRCQNLFTTISIHAPAKGATLSFDDIRKHIISFQSTLPRRERPQTAPQGQAHSHFNPRSREGSDLAANGLLTSGLTISIHAPAKGATLQPFALLLGRCISIHAPAKGATHYATPAPVLAGFQSTLPRRERPVALSLISFSRSFQSTLPRRERLQLTAERCETLWISIHAPAKGATTS